MVKSKVQSSIDAATALARHALACALGDTVTLEQMDNALSHAGLTIDTLAGPARLKLYPAERCGANRKVVTPWLYFQFSDPERAHHCRHVDQQRLNPFSGKYNFMGLDARDCMAMEIALKKIEARPAAST